MGVRTVEVNREVKALIRVGSQSTLLDQPVCDHVRQPDSDGVAVA